MGAYGSPQLGIFAEEECKEKLDNKRKKRSNRVLLLLFLCVLLITVVIVPSLVASDHKTTDINCSNCGESISTSASFCSSCGTALKISETTAENSETTAENKEPTTSSTPSTVGSASETNAANSTESAHLHSYVAATCTSPAMCSCGATSGSALGHSYSNGKCSRCGSSDPNYNPISISKQNALKKAKSYLNYSAFSKQGLIEQLEYEKFTLEQAQYGVNNCGANWNEQAEKKAESYLKYSAFSRQRLIEQLEYEGFTHEQAVYGVSAVGL